jgi:DNA repair protein SbcC/Rad50
MAQRLDLALAAARGDEQARSAFAAQSEANGERRRGLCLQLEVLAQVDSPPGLAEEHMALQVARLSGHMAGGEQAPLAGASDLLADWYRCGPAPADAELESRFERARFALALAETGRRAP